MKTPDWWHVIQTWVVRGDSGKVMYKLTLKGQEENSHLNHVTFSEEESVEVRFWVEQHGHRERRAHGSSWATMSCSKCWSIEQLHITRCQIMKDLGSLLMNLNLISKTMGNFGKKKLLK